VGQSHVLSAPDRTLDTVLTEWRACRVDKVIREPWTDVPFADAFKGQKALECLSGRGYVVVDIPPMVDQTDPMRPPR
jgi:hypothetical protein